MSMFGIRKEICTVVTLVFLETFAFGLTVPQFPRLVESLLGRSPSASSVVYGSLLATQMVCVFLFSPLLGTTSDRYGRRPVMIVSLGGSVVAYLLQVFAISIPLLFLSRIIVGICGANAAPARAYISDIAKPDERVTFYSQLLAAAGVGVILGPSVGGLLGSFQSSLPFLAAAFTSLLALTLCTLLLPESLKTIDRRKCSWSEAMPFFFVPWLRKAPPIVRGLSLTAFLEEFAIGIPQASLVLFMQATLKWGSSQIGYYLTITGAAAAVFQIFFASRSIRILGNVRALISGLSAATILLAAGTFITNSTEMYLFGVAACLVTLIGPAAQALLAEELPSNQMGKLQGTLSSLGCIAGAGGALVGTYAFKTFTDKANAPWAQAPFLLGAIFLIPAVVYTIFLFSKVRGKKLTATWPKQPVTEDTA